MTSVRHSEPAPDVRERNRRRRYIINSAFQWKYAVTIALVIFMVSFMMSSGLYGLLQHQARMRLMSPQTYTAEVTLVMFLFAGGFSVVTAVGVGLWCIVASHRICGPLFVLERYLEELACGSLPKIRPLRRKDEFKELHRAFTAAVDSLRQQKQSDFAALGDALRTAEAALDGHDETRRTAIESLMTQLGSLRQAAADALGNEAYDVHAPRVPASRPVRPVPVEAAC
jgi:methyl-accepting chemotaxis protein